MKSGWLAGLLLLLACATGVAQDYSLSVEQRGANLFKVVGQEIYLQTRYCYVEAGTAEVQLELDEDGGGRIAFKALERSCDVAAAYAKSSLDAREYPVTVSRVDSNWYALDGEAAMLLTDGCLSQVSGAAARLNMTSDGSGMLTIADAEECRVEAIYAPLARD